MTGVFSHRTKRTFLVTGGFLCASMAFADAHFVGKKGEPLAEYEYAYTALQDYFGQSVPKPITVERPDKQISQFDPSNNHVLASRGSGPMECAVEHESSHLALFAVTKGASNQEEFRFFDEGFAKIFGETMCNRGARYKRYSQRVAQEFDAAGKISFAQVQKWSLFFGNPQRDMQNTNWKAYDVGASFNYFMIDTYGFDTLKAFFIAVGERKDLTTAFQSVMNKDVATIEKEWKTYIARPEALSDKEKAEADNWPHFFSPDGKPLPRISTAYDGLVGYFGQDVPERFTIENAPPLADPGLPKIDFEHRLIGVPIEADGNIACNAVGGSMQIAVAELTKGVSRQDDFMFIQIGLSKAFEPDVCGGRWQYKDDAIAVAKAEAAAGNVSFEKVQKWSFYTPGGKGRSVAASFSFFMLDKYGKSALVNLLKTIATTKELDNASTAVLKKDAATLEKEWIQYLSQSNQ